MGWGSYLAALDDYGFIEELLMDINDKNDAVVRRMQAMIDRVAMLKENDLYFYNLPVDELRGGARVVVDGHDMGMYASYSYLGLVGHPRINKAAQDAKGRRR